MSEHLEHKIETLSQTVRAMGTSFSQDRRETNRILEKIVQTQGNFATQIAERSAYDKAIAEDMSELKSLAREQAKIIGELRITDAANTEFRLDVLAKRNRVYGVLVSVAVTIAVAVVGVLEVVKRGG